MGSSDWIIGLAIVGALAVGAYFFVVKPYGNKFGELLGDPAVKKEAIKNAMNKGMSKAEAESFLKQSQDKLKSFHGRPTAAYTMRYY